METGKSVIGLRGKFEAKVEFRSELRAKMLPVFGLFDCILKRGIPKAMRDDFHGSKEFRGARRTLVG